MNNKPKEENVIVLNDWDNEISLADDIIVLPPGDDTINIGSSMADQTFAVDGHGDAHDTPARSAAHSAPTSNFDQDVDTAEKSFAAEPVAAPKPAQKAEDILAMIRSRQQK